MISKTVLRPLRSIAPDWIVAATLMLIVVALWLPFGLKVGFVGDDWFFYMNVRHGSAWATLGRPLLPLPFILGYTLGPGSFVGFNLLLLLLLFFRGMLTYALLRSIGGVRAFSFAVSALTMLCPADTGIFYMGAVAVYLAWDAYLLALFLLTRYWRRPRLGVLALLWCAQIVCLGIYEAAYPLIVLSPLILYFLPYPSRRKWIGALWRWYVFPVLNAVRILVLLVAAPAALNYQSGLVQQPATINGVIGSTLNLFPRHLLTSWFAGEISGAFLPLALGVGLLCAFVWRWLVRREAAMSTRFLMILLGSGLTIILLGTAIYLPTSLRDDTIRTYYASSIGAALALVALFYLIPLHGKRITLIILLVAFNAFGAGQLIQQHATYAQQSRTQQQALADVAAQVPSIQPGSALLFMDETEDRNLLSVFWNTWHFQNPFLVMYDDPSLAVAVCFPNALKQDPSFYCAFQADGVEVRISPQIVWRRPYDLVILVRYTAEHEFVLAPDLAPYGHSSAYKPEARINFDSPLPEVVRRMFTAHNDLELGISTPRP